MEKNLQVQRHELKFYINRSDYLYAKSVLKHLMQRDSHQTEERGYFIRSLYFDDIYDRSVEEKLAGVEHRDKYRLRIYDFDQQWVKLERKRKENNYVQKTSAIITRQEALNMMEGNYDDLFKYREQNFNSLYYDFKRTYMRPVVIVDYVRDVFMLDYNEIRITFDKHLRSNTTDLELFNPDLITEPIQRDDVIIMEVKFYNCLPSWFSLLQFESATASAISKYCQTRMGTREFYFE